MQTLLPSGGGWNKFVESCFRYDFYHTAEYHRLAESEGEGDPQLLIYEEGPYSIGIPLLVRHINNILEPDTLPFFDATSVYGYAGPLASHKSLPEKFVRNFHVTLKKHLLRNKIVSVFSRLHTLWDQRNWLNGIGEVEDLSKTISIDLELPLAEQRAKYRKSNKSEINQLRRTIKCRYAESQKDIDDYIEIYLQNMKRVGAANRYFFSKEYFYQLLAAKDFECFIMLAENDTEVIAGGMFIVINNIVQYHLAGTREQYLKLAPMKLILDEMRIEATKRGLKYFHLGGGVGGNDDSLFRFKAGFSDKFHTFSVWKWIVDDGNYNRLVKSKFGTNIVNTRYFPLYRLPD